MMRFTSCFMPPGGAADIVDDGGADLYRVLAQKMPAAMLCPTSARSLWPSLSYTAGAPTATVLHPGLKREHSAIRQVDAPQTRRSCVMTKIGVRYGYSPGSY